MAKCLICESNYDPFVDFGDMPIANAFASKEDIQKEYTFPMKVAFCGKCKMVQLVDQPDREMMFHENYAFFSSTSNYMKQHFKKFADSVSQLQALNKNSFVVEIGSNDGIMLQNFINDEVPCLGVEPSKNVAEVARQKGIEVVTEFFDLGLSEKIIQSHGKADAILSANVMCHIPYMHSINACFFCLSKNLLNLSQFFFKYNCIKRKICLDFLLMAQGNNLIQFTK